MKWNFLQSGSNSLCFLLQFLRRPCNPCPCITEISDIKAQKEGNIRRKDGWEAWHPGMTTRRERTSSDEKQLRVVSVLNMGGKGAGERGDKTGAWPGTTIVSGKLPSLHYGNTTFNIQGAEQILRLRHHYCSTTLSTRQWKTIKNVC